MNDAARREVWWRLSDVGIHPESVAAAGGAVWCFGSRASDCARDDSDWDILVVHPTDFELERPTRGTCARANLDLTVISRPYLLAPALSELMSHVAEYGVLVIGDDEIRIPHDPSLAAERKVEWVRERVKRVTELWGSLQLRQQTREALRLRRDLQRAWLLSRGRAVPPTVRLDERWAHDIAARRALISWVPDPLRTVMLEDEGTLP